MAATTLLFLIALPIVNCRRRNVFSIEELGKHFSAKDYDQGKRGKGMNQAINAHSKGDRGIITRTEPCYSKKKICSMLSKVVELPGTIESKKICSEFSEGACRCGDPIFAHTCNSCEVNVSTESLSKK